MSSAGDPVSSSDFRRLTLTASGHYKRAITSEGGDGVTGRPPCFRRPGIGPDDGTIRFRPIDAGRATSLGILWRPQ